MGGTPEKGAKAAKLMAKLVAYTFAAGVDIDMEHLSPFTNEFPGSDEFAALISFITQLRTSLDEAASNWYDTAKARRTAMNNTYNSLESWKKTNVKDFYESNIRYLGEVMEQPVPYLEISWTTRFNAFLPDTDVWNYLLPDSGRMTKNFESDNEGMKIWPSIGDKVDKVNYGFAFLTTTPDPDQDGCGSTPPAGPCPVWDGQNIYLAKAAMQGSIAVSSSTTVEEASPSIVAIAEVVRMAHMHPNGPKRTKITLGGWSDFARLATAENGVKAAKLMGKFVAYTFAQGVDIDMEHLSPFTNEFEGADEFAALIGFITQLREEFKDVAANWYDTAKARQTAMNNTYQALESWKKTNVKDYYESSIRYLGEVMEQPVPYLEISWTTRFNAFLPDTDVWN